MTAVFIFYFLFPISYFLFSIFYFLSSVLCFLFFVFCFLFFYFFFWPSNLSLDYHHLHRSAILVSAHTDLGPNR